MSSVKISNQHRFIFQPLTALLIFCLNTLIVHSQIVKRACFLGNSYTASFNLPNLIQQFALANGDSLIVGANTPGGYTFQLHSTNSASLSLISQPGWDFMVLQEQSQLPSFPISQVATQCFPFATKLDTLFHQANPCAETVFFMTWGRKNGDASNCASWPPVCSYQGMDSLLHLRYRMMADTNKALLAPVGYIWRYIRNHYQNIELYSPDESHPSEAGSYAAAVTFYTLFFQKDPSQVKYDFSIDPTDAQTIRNIVKMLVFDSLSKWNINRWKPQANFSYSISGTTANFTNLSQNAHSWIWDLGDGNMVSGQNPSHTYSVNKDTTFTVTLKAIKCGDTAKISKNVFIQYTSGLQQCLNEKVNIFPNPFSHSFVVEIQQYKTGLCTITDLSGKIILFQQLQTLRNSIDLSEHPDGIYLITVSTGNNRIFRKLIKQTFVH